MEHLIFFLGLFSFLPSLLAPCSFFRARISRIRSKKTCLHIYVLEELHHNIKNSDRKDLKLRQMASHSP